MRIHVFAEALLHELPSGCEFVNGFCTEVTLRPAASNRGMSPARTVGKQAVADLAGFTRITDTTPDQIILLRCNRSSDP
jgi:hypothetical protein